MFTEFLFDKVIIKIKSSVQIRDIVFNNMQVYGFYAYDHFF
jgi:hypothetical protein